MDFLQLARSAVAKGRLGTAADLYQEALVADPLNTKIRGEFCVNALVPMGLHALAIQEAENILKVDPGCKDGFRILGWVHHKEYDAKKSVEYYDRLLAIDPDDPVSLLYRCSVALDLGQFDLLNELCRKVLSTENNYGGPALEYMALAEYRQGRHEAAIYLYDLALEAGGDRPTIEWNQSLALHSIGRYREGWLKHEARGRQTSNKPVALEVNRLGPLFNNEPPPCRLHLGQEMGFGDAIAMARYVPMLLERGYEVQMEVHEGLVDLFRDSLGVEVYPRSFNWPGSYGIPKFDYYVPMLSLPRLFGTEVETVPWVGPYLKADPELVKKYRAKINGGVGVCWSAGIRRAGFWMQEYGKRKSVPFEQIAPFIQGCVSLQVGEKPDGLINVLPDKPTWAETAALIECLDEVVSVDTGVAHLAGAMGKPLRLLMHTEGSWHWMAERPGASWNEKSPWYPSARLFRQKSPNEWGDVIGRVASEFRLAA